MFSAVLTYSIIRLCIQEIPVQFVDYGNEEFVTEIVMITKQLLYCLPFQGIPGQLSGNILVVY